MNIKAKSEGKLTYALKKLANFRFQAEKQRFHFESKMAELNKNENSKQLDQPDTVRKLYFTLQINA